MDWDTTQNLMIEGDNLEVLKLLQKSYAGRIKTHLHRSALQYGKKTLFYPDDYSDKHSKLFGN